MSASSAPKSSGSIPSSSKALKVVKVKPDSRSIFFKNEGLFADNYLLNRLPNEAHDSFILQHWQTEDLPQFNECYEWMLGTWEEYKDIFPTLSEAQLEDKWIRPILDRLGWTYEVQDRLKRHGKTQIPDYSLFSSQDSYKKAKGCANNDKYFSYVEAIADAKAMGVSLDGTARTNVNPSYQIVRYLEDTDRTWGILTDGEYWRLYSRRSKSKYTTYYEVNVRKLLSGRNDSPRDDEAFKYFFNFFRQASYADRDPAGKCFLDIVYDSGERYAREVETQLKERAFRIVESIAVGFANGRTNLSEKDLKEIYEHSLFYLFRLMFVLNCESKALLDLNDLSDYYPLSLRSLCYRLKNEFERNLSWSSRANTYSALTNLFDLLKSGDKALRISGFGGEVFESGSSRFFEKNNIPDAALNKALVELACAYSEEGELQFIDYARLNADHLGSLFEGLLEYRLNYAAEDLIVDKKGTIESLKSAKVKKASAKGEVIKKGELYLSTGSGDRKASGAYYTPEYVVDYIVENTLSPLCANRSADEIFNLKVCDPAMGSGHFLLGAVRYLEDQVRRKSYEEDGEAIDINPGEIRWKILHNCIYGVDINPLAVELSKFSLWMYTARKDFPLEPLADQLKCGDSLIPPSPAYKGGFDWKEEFALIFKRGAFDSVIGNPPYVALDDCTEEVRKHLESIDGDIFASSNDIYYHFLKKFIELAKPEGRFGLITSRYYLEATHARKLREFIGENAQIDILVDFQNVDPFNEKIESETGELVTKQDGVGLKTALLIGAVSKSGGSVATRMIRVAKRYWDGPTAKLLVNIQRLSSSNLKRYKREDGIEAFPLPTGRFKGEAWDLKPVEWQNMISKLSSCSTTLNDLYQDGVKVGQGMVTGKDGAFTLSVADAKRLGFSDSEFQTLLKNGDIRRFQISHRGDCWLTPHRFKASDKRALKYLEDHKKSLLSRGDFKKGRAKYNWWEYSRVQNESLMAESTKIVTPYKSFRNNFALDTSRSIFSADVYGISLSKKFDAHVILALLNSSICEFNIKYYAKKIDYRYEYYEQALSKVLIPKKLLDLGSPKSLSDASIKSLEGMSENEILLLGRDAQTASSYLAAVAKHCMAAGDSPKFRRWIDLIVGASFGLTMDEIDWFSSWVDQEIADNLTNKQRADSDSDEEAAEEIVAS